LTLLKHLYVAQLHLIIAQFNTVCGIKMGRTRVILLLHFLRILLILAAQHQENNGLFIVSQDRGRTLINASKDSNAQEWQARYEAGESLEDIFDCVGTPDQSRWRHEDPMYRNQFICSVKEAFVFGMNDRGELVWSDVSKGTMKKYFEPRDDMKNSGVVPTSFQLSRHAQLQIYDANSTLIWTHDPVRSGIDVRNCITSYQCPYMHLHNDGVNVLNFIDPISGTWVPSGMDRAYGF